MNWNCFGHGRRVVQIGMLANALMLGGCATFSDDGGFAAVEAESKKLIDHTPRWMRDEPSKATARDEVAQLLMAPLSADSAVRVALLNNPRLQSEYQNLGVSEADLVQAGRLQNPGFSFSKTTGGGAQEIERGLHFNILALLTLPLRSEIEHRRFEAAKLAAVSATIDTAMQARSGFIEAVANQQVAAYFQQVVESADASRELMERMRRVGNASGLELAREQLFHAEAVAAFANARMRAQGARERLNRALGVWGEQLEYSLPERLPDLPAAPRDLADVERKAIEQRLDIRMQRQRLESLAASLGLSKATRFVNVFEAGPTQVRERGEAKRDGYEVSLEIPIFDWGDARVARAEALVSQATNRLRATAIDARSEARDAYRTYRTTYDLAKHYRDEIVPLRKRISDEQLLRYNGMLVGVFELIADAREQIASVSMYIEALRTFWLADAALRNAMTGASRSQGPSLMTNALLPTDNAGQGH